MLTIAGRRLPHLGMLYGYAVRSAAHRAAVLFAVSTATIIAALVLEHGFGMVPCKLCLWQRWPYYAAVPLAALAFLIAGPLATPRAARPAFAALATIFMISVGLGAFHAGVEWGWWQGPADCGGRIIPGPEHASGLLEAMLATRVVNCAEVSFTFLGLSLAGWNALISFVLAGIAIRGWRGTPPTSAALG